MPPVGIRKLVFPFPILRDPKSGKWRYTGKDTDGFSHYCPIGHSTAKECLEVCEYNRQAQAVGGELILGCAFEQLIEQGGTRHDVPLPRTDLAAAIRGAHNDWMREKQKVFRIDRTNIDEHLEFNPRRVDLSKPSRDWY